MLDRRPVEPRLLRKEQAAVYCGLDRMSFTRLCPVPAVRLADKIRRWDRKALDQWLDTLTDAPENRTAEDWLGEIRNAAKSGVHRASEGR